MHYIPLIIDTNKQIKYSCMFKTFSYLYKTKFHIIIHPCLCIGSTVAIVIR